MTSEFTQKDFEQIESRWRLLEQEAAQRCRYPHELEVVRKAYRFAYDAHINIRRRSGTPYIIHPIEVARIVISDIGLGYKSIVTALLHDVLEDTDYTIDDIREQFGEKISTLVEGMNRIRTMLDMDMKTEHFKKVLISLGDDARVVLIKLADRLHNCRTIELQSEQKRRKILDETMYIFIPLAHRLGLYSVKSEMENIWLEYEQREDFESIRKRIESEKDGMEREMDELVYDISAALDEIGIKYSIKRRIKSPYSIWKKMNVKGVAFEEIFDLCAVRIIFECDVDNPALERRTAYMVFAIVTGMFSYLPARTRDWIKRPKSNGYEALHCTVLNKQGHWVEVQIRSTHMDDIAEKGLAAHWTYKRNGYSSENDSLMEKWLSRVREVLSCNDNENLDTLELIHKDLVSKEISVFDTKGNLVNIPSGATALEYAEITDPQNAGKAVAAKINRKLSPLTQALKQGDMIEIIAI